ncbi:Clavesin-2 [Eumeta japonica]|uniref:Clavesin-2 n=1 Tax=Eumeta variegata TaxID=151549 RepID=A0A4C1TRR4_EUMVA|nr:Clavesin-2 [Eumeta japonica]
MKYAIKFYFSLRIVRSSNSIVVGTRLCKRGIIRFNERAAARARAACSAHTASRPRALWRRALAQSSHRVSERAVSQSRSGPPMNEYAEYDWRLPLPAAQRCGVGRVRLSDGDRQRALRGLRDAVDASLNLALRDKSRCQDDAFLRRFLYARKHDVQRSFELLVRYYEYRRAHPEFWAPADGGVLRALADGLPGVLAQRDRRGRCVLVLFAANWTPHACPLLSVYRALLLTLERTLDDVQNQANGYVVVVDWTEFTFKQSRNLQPKTLKLMIDGLQDCLPVRFKSIHFIGQPWYVETALAVIKPYLHAKTRDRIVLHGNNLSTLHDALPLDILPAELGGEGPSYNSERWLQEFCRGENLDPTPGARARAAAPNRIGGRRSAHR